MINDPFVTFVLTFTLYSQAMKWGALKLPDTNMTLTVQNANLPLFKNSIGNY